MNALRLLEVLKDARDEGRWQDQAAVLDEIGVDAAYRRCLWATTLVREVEPITKRRTHRRVHAETYLIGVKVTTEMFAISTPRAFVRVENLEDRERLRRQLTAEYFRVRSCQPLVTSDWMHERTERQLARIRDQIDALGDITPQHSPADETNGASDQH